MIGKRDDFAQLFDILLISGKEISKGMKSQNLFPVGFILKTTKSYANIYAGNARSAPSVIGFSRRKLAEFDITCEATGTVCVTYPDKFLARMKRIRGDAEIRLEISDTEVQFEVHGRNSGYVQEADVKKSFAIWQDIPDLDLEKSDGKYQFKESEQGERVVSMDIDSTEILKIVDSADMMGVANYPIKIKDGKVHFAVENTEEWDRITLDAEIEDESVEYEESFADGIDSVFRYISGAASIVVEGGNFADTFVVSKIDGDNETVFVVASMPKESDDADPEEYVEKLEALEEVAEDWEDEEDIEEDLADAEEYGDD